MATTVHRKHQGEQRTFLVVPATDATGREVGSHVFQVTDDGPEYVGEGDAVGDWEPDEELTNDDAPQSALNAAREADDV
ncbi:hypothetical protein [Halolamina salina]|uniref:Uncharacterized protein n=1 Tax=Halolamina salina TaxID=1220023 RepID=A0ABD6B8Y5_9EURY